MAANVNQFVSPELKEEFPQFLRNTTYTLTNNVYDSKDNTYNKTKSLRDNKNIVIFSGDKDSSIVIMNKIDYDKKLEQIINEGIERGKYEKTDDNILKELESFQSFLYRHFKDGTYCKQMSHQPARFFASAKTHKFGNLSDINLTNLKLLPIFDQTGTCYYKTGKVISNYLKPLTKNKFVINNTQDFPAMLNNVPISEDEEDVSFDVESLFTNIPIKDTIDFICEEIYVHKKLEPICNKSIFKKLLYKLTTECAFSVTGKLQKQVGGVSMGGTLSVTLSDRFMNKMGRDVVLPLKPKFYRRFVDDTYKRRKKNKPDELFSNMNSYHPNINLTIKINPSKFLDTNIARNNTNIKCFSYHKDNKLPFHWKSAVPRNYKKNVIVGDLHRANKISSDLDEEISIIKAKYLKAGYPSGFIDSVIDFHQTREDFLIPPSLFEEPKETSCKETKYLQIRRIHKL